MTPDPAHSTAFQATYAFGDFVLDGQRCELRRGGTLVAVEPKVLSLLLLLAHQRDRVVSHDEILDALWPGQSISEEALKYCVRTARRALGDSGAEQHTIATVRRFGYRFVAHAFECPFATPPPAAHAGARDPAVREHGPQGFFVGRESVMARLRGALAATLTGRGRVALLVGEPGIGKTRAAEELVRSAVQRDVEALVGRCHEGSGAPPFWPWVQIVRSWVASHEPAAIVATMGATLADLVPLVPDLAMLVGAPPAPSPATDDARFRLFDGVTRFLLRAAEQRPIVVVLDDLHWADKPSLLLLRFLAREIGGARLLVLGAVRETAVVPDHPLVACMADLARTAGFSRIELDGLTAVDVGRFIEAATGEPATPATAREVHERTGGNPFFLTETVRLALAEHPAGFPPSKARFAVPGSVRDVVRQRLETVSPGARRLLRVAAVCGREFDSAVLLRVAERGHRPVRAEVLRCLDEAVRVRLVEPRADAPGGYRFAHALVAETIYSALSSAERSRLHEGVGAAIERVHASDPGPHLTALAYHFGVAALAGHSRRAIDYAVRAGGRAAGMSAWEDAVTHYRNALALIEQSGTGQRRRPPSRERNRADDGDTVDALLFGLGENLWKSGELARAKEMFRRAAARAREVGSPTRLAQAALGFGGGFRGFELGEVEPELIELLEEALRTLPRRPSGLRSLVTARLAVALYHVSDSLPRRQALSQEAVRQAARTKDRAAELAALYSRHGAIWGPDTLNERVETAEAMLRLAQRVDDREATFHARRFHFLDSLELGDIEAVDADLEECMRLGEELRQPYYLWYAATARALRLLLEGRLAESERWAQDALAAGRRAQSRNVEQVHGSQLLWIRREQGRLAEVEPSLRSLVERFPTLPVWRCAHAFVLAELDRTTEARAQLDVLAAYGFAAIARDAFWLSAICALADVCAHLGDVDRAAVLHRLLRPYSGRIVQVSIGAGCLGAADRVLGRLAALLQRWDLAEEHFAHALASERRLRAPLLVARTQCDRAAALLARGRPRDAREALRQLAHADTAYATLGVPPTRVAALRDRALSMASQSAGKARPRGRAPRGASGRRTLRRSAGTRKA